MRMAQIRIFWTADVLERVSKYRAVARLREIGRSTIAIVAFGLAALGGAAAPASAQPFSKTIVFGDSNVDSGYYKQLTSPGGGATYNSYWASAVAHGAGAPTTNPAPMKSQMLAAYFGLFANPANTPGGTNYATSGAKDSTVNTTQTGGFQAAIPTVTQMSNYLTANGGAADPNALYLINSGDNDVAYAIGEQGQGPYPTDTSAYITQAATNLANAIIGLKTAGAQKIMVAGLQDGFGSTQLKRTLRTLHNTTLWNALTTANVPFYRADVNSVRTAIVANPTKYGFTSVAGSAGCTVPAGVTTAWSLLCSSDPAAPSTWVNASAPFTFLFADDQHFGTAGQRYVARYFRSLVIPWTVTHDFYGAGKSSVVWRNATGDTVFSRMNGAAIAGSDFVVKLGAPWTLAGTGDFYSDGKAALLWRNATTGDVVVSRTNGATIVSSTFVANVPTSFSIVGVADFDGDGYADILWRDTNNGNLLVSLMNGATVKTTNFLANLSTTWQVVGVGDADGDGKADILWRNTTNNDYVGSLTNGYAIINSTFLANVPTPWQVAGVGDFDGSGTMGVLWRNATTGDVALSTNVTGTLTTTFIASVPPTWSVGVLGDFDGDGKTDVLWRDSSNGNAVVSLFNGAAIASSTFVANVPTDWTVENTNAN